VNAGAEAQGLRALHQYQFDGSHANRNECTLCSMAMVLTQAARVAGAADFWLPAAALGRHLDRVPFRMRFPAWLPGPGGATHPWAALWGLRAYGRKLERDGVRFPWRPVLRTRQTPAALRAVLDAKQPTLIYGLGGGVPHVVVPVAYADPGWSVLDPGYPSAENPKLWSDEKLAAWWKNFSIFYPPGTMITLERIDQ
jgi:hypothetical protein